MYMPHKKAMLEELDKISEALIAQETNIRLQYSGYPQADLIRDSKGRYVMTDILVARAQVMGAIAQVLGLPD